MWEIPRLHVEVQHYIMVYAWQPEKTVKTSYHTCLLDSVLFLYEHQQHNFIQCLQFGQSCFIKMNILLFYTTLPVVNFSYKVLTSLITVQFQSIFKVQSASFHKSSFLLQSSLSVALKTIFQAEIKLRNST